MTPSKMKHATSNERMKHQNSANIFEAIQDLLVIVPMNEGAYMKFYNTYKDKPHIVATLIWTYSKQILYNSIASKLN